MAIGAITVVNKTQTPGPLNVDQISFAGDATYPAGGTPGFQALVRAALGKGTVTILYVVAQDCGGLIPFYDNVNDKLKIFYTDNNNAADGPLIENIATDLHLTTLKIVVLSK